SRHTRHRPQERRTLRAEQSHNLPVPSVTERSSQDISADEHERAARECSSRHSARARRSSRNVLLQRKAKRSAHTTTPHHRIAKLGLECNPPLDNLFLRRGLPSIPAIAHLRDSCRLDEEWRRRTGLPVPARSIHLLESRRVLVRDVRRPPGIRRDQTVYPGGVVSSNRAT